MNIIITGACGHIGTYVTDNLYKIKKIKNIYLIDNLNSKNYNFFFKKRNNKKIKYFFKDLTNNSSLKQFKKIDILIHFASMTNAADSFKIKKQMYYNNIKCFENVVNFCIKKKVKLIHLSSTSVYGKQAKVVDENCEKKYLKPQSPYAKIKIIEENILKKINNKIRYITLRLGTISGVSDGIRFHTAVNKFCLNASLEEPINVYKTALNQYRPYLSLSDAFKTFKFIIDKNFFKNDIYNILTNNYTVKEIIQMIKNYKKKVKIKFVYNKIMNQLSYHVSKEKISKEGLILGSSIEKDIKDTLNLLREIK